MMFKGFQGKKETMEGEERAYFNETGKPASRIVSGPFDR